MALFASASAGNPVMAHEGIDDALDNDIAQVRAESMHLDIPQDTMLLRTTNTSVTAQSRT